LEVLSVENDGITVSPMNNVEVQMIMSLLPMLQERIQRPEVTLHRGEELNQLAQYTIMPPNGEFSIRYEGEDGQDDNGLFREALTEAFNQMECDFFTKDPTTGALTPSHLPEASLAKALAQHHLRGCGRIMGIAASSHRSRLNDTGFAVHFDDRVYKAIVTLHEQSPSFFYIELSSDSDSNSDSSLDTNQYQHNPPPSQALITDQNLSSSSSIENDTMSTPAAQADHHAMGETGDEEIDESSVESSDHSFNYFNLDLQYEKRPIDTLRLYNGIFGTLEGSEALVNRKIENVDQLNAVNREALSFIEQLFPNGEIKNYLEPFVTIADGFLYIAEHYDLPIESIVRLQETFQGTSLFELLDQHVTPTENLFPSENARAREFLCRYILEQRPGESHDDRKRRSSELAQFLTGSKCVGPRCVITLLVENHNRMPVASTCYAYLRLGSERLQNYEQFRDSMDEAVAGSKGRFDLR